MTGIIGVNGKELRSKRDQEQIEEIQNMLNERKLLLAEKNFYIQVIFHLLDEFTEKGKHEIPDEKWLSFNIDHGIEFGRDEKKKVNTLEIVKIIE